MVYDSVVRPFYKNNEEAINNISHSLETYFEKKTAQVQSKVSESATDSIYAPTQKSEASSGIFWWAPSTPATARRRRRKRSPPVTTRTTKNRTDLIVKPISYGYIYKRHGTTSSLLPPG
jgi:hypothetical protein